MVFGLREKRRLPCVPPVVDIGEATLARHAGWGRCRHGCVLSANHSLWKVRVLKGKLGLSPLGFPGQTPATVGISYSYILGDVDKYKTAAALTVDKLGLDYRVQHKTTAGTKGEISYLGLNVDIFFFLSVEPDHSRSLYVSFPNHPISIDVFSKQQKVA